MQEIHRWFGGQFDRAYRIHVNSTALTNTAAKISTNTFAQIAATDYVEFVSGSADDTTQTAYISFIDTNGKANQMSKALNGATAVKPTTATVVYVNQFWVSAACAGTITLRRDTGDTAIGTVTIGTLHSDVGHWYAGDIGALIIPVRAGISSTDGSAEFQMRVYPLAASTTTGYDVVDRIIITNAVQTETFDSGEEGIFIPAGGKFEVWADASGDNTDGFFTFDVIPNYRR